MGASRRGRRRVHRSRRLCAPRQERLGGMVCAVWRFRPDSSDTTPLHSRDYRHHPRGSCAGATRTSRLALDGILGILDGASATDYRHARLGFRRAMGKLGSPARTPPLTRLASLSERVVAVSILSLTNTSCLHRPVVFREYHNERGEKASPFLSGAIPKAPVTGACLLLLSPAPLPQTRVPLRPWRNNRRCEYGKEGVRFQTAHRER